MYLMHAADFQLFGRMKSKKKVGRKIEKIVARSPCVLHLSPLSLLSRAVNYELYLQTLTRQEVAHSESLDF